jgi:hypothetical protein
MCLRVTFTSLALSLLLIGASFAQTPPQETFSIDHVTVIDPATGNRLADRTVVLHGDGILSVQPSSPASAAQGRVIDAHGGFLIPGLCEPSPSSSTASTSTAPPSTPFSTKPSAATTKANYTNSPSPNSL